jgi:predicted N-formylglutamate amidohydrolase
VTRNFFLVTCEHGGNRIPARYQAYFSGHADLLATHRGYDMGALAMARALASSLSAPLHYSTTSRLLVDLNRSPRHPGLFSEISKTLPPPLRREILERHYLPYRTEVESLLEEVIGQGFHVIHVSSHSFTPELHGQVRNADIGLLYDAKRSSEVALCHRWRAALKEHAPELKVRMNYPYSGSSDGLAAALRKRFCADVYAGIELELNQLHAQACKEHWRALRTVVVCALHQAVS